MKNLEIELVKVCEKAAVNAHSSIGLGNKKNIDRAAVEAIRDGLNRINKKFRIVIGEGEIDDAPMLYEGELLGTGIDGVYYDVAVDPIECTTLSAKGIDGALTVMAISTEGTLLSAPDMYMEKLMVGSKGKGAIDLDRSLEDNIVNVARKLKKEMNELTISVLDKPRHAEVIKYFRSKGIRVFTPPEGDVLGGLYVALENGDIDLLYGIGGAPEGVISAVALKALGGEINAKLLLRSQVKGMTFENDKISLQEQARCKEKGLVVNQTLTTDDLVKSDDAFLIATGITNSGILYGVTKIDGHLLQTQSLFINGKDGDVQFILSEHEFTIN